MLEDESLRRRYGRHAGFGVALLVLLAVPALIHSQAAIDTLFNNPVTWVPDSASAKADFNTFSRHFSATDVVMIGWDGSTLGSQSLERATRLLRPLAAQTDAERTDQEVLEPLPPWAEEQITEIQRISGTATPLHWVRTGSEMVEQMTSQPANLPRPVAVRRLQGTVIGPDGKQTCLLISIDKTALVHRRELLPALRTLLVRGLGRPAGQLAMVGAPIDGVAVDEASVRSVRMFAPPSALVAIVLCFLCLRSIPLTAAITAIALIGEGLVLAAVYYTGTAMNAVLIVLPPLVFVLTVSAGIHLSNYYLDAAHEFPELSQAGAVRLAMHTGVAPCLLASGTTVIGLSSLMLVRLEPIRIFGGVASAGVITTLLLLLLVLPGAMLLTPPPAAGPEHDRSRSWLRRQMRVRMRRQLRRPWPLIILFAVIGCLFAVGLGWLQTSANIPRMFEPTSDLRQQQAWFEEHIAPVVSGELLLEFSSTDEEVDMLERLDLVKQVHVGVLEHDQVRGALSAVSFIPPVPTGRSLAATSRRSIARALIRDPESSLRELGFIERDTESQIWRVSLRMPQKQATDYRAEIAEIPTIARQVAADSDLPVKITLTGGLVITQTAQEVMFAGLFRSFLTAFGIVAIVMVLLLHSIQGGLLAMVPNLFPTITLFGLMGWLKEPLDIGSVMTASVALGIAVDDTVHLLSRFGSRRARGLERIEAAFGALSQCGWAMLQTTLVCGLALMVYWFSDFVPTSRFAVLMFGLLTAALVCDVFFLPALMSSRFGHWLARPVGAAADADVYHD